MKSMNFAFIVLLVLTASATALPGAGEYSMSDIIVRNLPAKKQNGSAWDPFGGAPDVLVAIYIDYGDEVEHYSSTSEKENSGSSAIWSRTESFFVSAGEANREDVELLIKVWDIDSRNGNDFIDSGKISFSDLETGEVELELNYGTVITFELEGPFTYDEGVCEG
ncbi:MAG: hypothetical protein KAS73_00920 [Candidatus Sabulitectum sp.]|nr:hypothetical protein [Candidatus Sabulitectum sp.]